MVLLETIEHQKLIWHSNVKQVPIGQFRPFIFLGPDTTSWFVRYAPFQLIGNQIIMQGQRAALFDVLLWNLEEILAEFVRVEHLDMSSLIRKKILSSQKICEKCLWTSHLDDIVNEPYPLSSNNFPTHSYKLKDPLFLSLIH